MHQMSCRGDYWDVVYHFRSGLWKVVPILEVALEQNYLSRSEPLLLTMKGRGITKNWVMAEGGQQTCSSRNFKESHKKKA